MGGLHGDCIQSYLYIYISIYIYIYISIYLQGDGSVATVFRARLTEWDIDWS